MISFARESAVIILLLGAGMLQPARGQVESPANPAVTSPDHVSGAAQLPITAVWRFGLKVQAMSDTTGIQATVPVPMQWPEQNVKVLSINKPHNVAVARIREENDSSELFFSIGRLAAGEEIVVTVDVEVEKLASAVPENPQSFQFDKRPKSSIRKFLTPSPFIESDDKTIVELALSLPIDETQPAWNQVESIYNWVRQNVEYQFDPEIRSCLTALENRHGDCEELSSLFIALCRARGIPARAVWIPGHTYPEFYLVDESGKERWFPCQAAGTAAFGFMPEARPILQKGDKFKTPGQREEVRYNQPTLKARDALVNPTITWIMEPLVNDQTNTDK